MKNNFFFIKKYLFEGVVFKEIKVLYIFKKAKKKD